MYRGWLVGWLEFNVPKPLNAKSAFWLVRKSENHNTVQNSRGLFFPQSTGRTAIFCQRRLFCEWWGTKNSFIQHCDLPLYTQRVKRHAYLLNAVRIFLDKAFFVSHHSPGRTPRPHGPQWFITGSAGKCRQAAGWYVSYFTESDLFLLGQEVTTHQNHATKACHKSIAAWDRYHTTPRTDLQNIRVNGDEIVETQRVDEKIIQKVGSSVSLPRATKQIAKHRAPLLLRCSRCEFFVKCQQYFCRLIRCVSEWRLKSRIRRAAKFSSCILSLAEIAFQLTWWSFFFFFIWAGFTAII